MKNKKNLLIIGVAALAVPFGFALNNSNNVKAEPESEGYCIKFNSEKNSYNAENEYDSDTNETFEFESSGLSQYASGFATFNENGYFKNTEIITGINGIEINTNNGGSFKIEYGYDSDALIFKKEFADNTSYVFDFRDNSPNYFKITSLAANLSFESMEIDFICANTHSNWKKDYGMIPQQDNENGTVEYGLYPQSVVTNTTIISKLSSQNSDEMLSQGFYAYGGNLYYPATAHPYQSTYTFNGQSSAIVDNNQYWFNVEPILWNVIDVGNNNTLLFANKALDTHAYSSSLIAYENSNIRSWLNEDFYNLAFGFADSYIKSN